MTKQKIQPNVRDIKMDLEKLLPPNDYFKPSYEHYCAIGKKHISNCTAHFVLLSRNIEPKLKTNFEKILRLAQMFKNYTITVFENDSKDNTLQELKNLEKKYPNFKVLSDKFNREHFGPVKNKQRVTALAEYRNLLKNYISDHYDVTTPNNYTIVMDSDFIDFSINGVYNSFGWLLQYKEINAICGNSFEIKTNVDSKQQSLWNYDSWAFRGSWWHDLQLDNNLTDVLNFDRMFWFGVWILPVGSKPITINSGFGGMCIYSTPLYITSEYKNYDCEHVTFNKELSEKYQPFHFCLNPSQIMLV